jgi:transcriptional regulator with XRE-family HTH domain
MINAEQIRAARAILDWSTVELAKQAGLTVNGINKIERGHVQAHRETVEKLREVFETSGIEFLGNSGVQKRQETVYALKGVEGFKKLMDDVYLTACDPSATDGKKPICISNVDDRLFMKHLGDYMVFHAQRMNDLKKVRVRILAREEDFYEIPDNRYIEYRFSPKQGDGNVPFYVYGDKLAILMLDETQALQIIVIASTMVAKAYRGQFEVLWQISKTPESGVTR